MSPESTPIKPGGDPHKQAAQSETLRSDLRSLVSDLKLRDSRSRVGSSDPLRTDVRQALGELENRLGVSHGFLVDAAVGVAAEDAARLRRFCPEMLVFGDGRHEAHFQKVEKVEIGQPLRRRLLFAALEFAERAGALDAVGPLAGLGLIRAKEAVDIHYRVGTVDMLAGRLEVGRLYYTVPGGDDEHRRFEMFGITTIGPRSAFENP